VASNASILALVLVKPISPSDWSWRSNRLSEVIDIGGDGLGGATVGVDSGLMKSEEKSRPLLFVAAGVGSDVFVVWSVAHGLL